MLRQLVFVALCAAASAFAPTGKCSRVLSAGGPCAPSLSCMCDAAARAHRRSPRNPPGESRLQARAMQSARGSAAAAVASLAARSALACMMSGHRWLVVPVKASAAKSRTESGRIWRMWGKPRRGFGCSATDVSVMRMRPRSTYWCGAMPRRLQVGVRNVESCAFGRVHPGSAPGQRLPGLRRVDPRHQPHDRSRHG